MKSLINIPIGVNLTSEEVERTLVDRIKMIERTRRFLIEKEFGNCDFAADYVYQKLSVLRMEHLMELDNRFPGKYPLKGEDIFNETG